MGPRPQSGSGAVAGVWSLEWRGGTVSSQGGFEVAEEKGVSAGTNDSFSSIYKVMAETSERRVCEE